jgi:competence protein ComEA
VWAPIALKLAGAALGMLGLAAIGASSVAHGSRGAHAVPAGPASAPRTTANLTPFGGARQGSAPAPSTSAPPPAADAGTDAESADAGPPGAITADGKVILNRAGIDELTELPGIGPKRAQAILELRQKLGGRFKRLSDLLRLKGIGPKGLKKIEAKAVLD